jgi:hypothetical protein
MNLLVETLEKLKAKRVYVNPQAIDLIAETEWGTIVVIFQSGAELEIQGDRVILFRVGSERGIEVKPVNEPESQ